MSAGIAYSPESMTYTLFDGTNSLKLPNWAHRVIVEEFEREVRPLNGKIEILSDALALARAENAKLRELVRVLCYCMHESTDCDGCRLNDGAGRMALDAFWACDGLHERLRELGIEVSDG